MACSLLRKRSAFAVFILSVSFGLFTLEAAAQTPAERLLAFSPEDPFLRLLAYPNQSLQALESGQATASQLGRILREDVVPYFQANEESLEAARQWSMSWSPSFARDFWAGEELNIDELRLHLQVPSNLSTREQAFLFAAYFSQAIDQILLSSELRFKIWLNGFVATREKSFVDVRSYMQLSSRFALNAETTARQFLESCVRDFGGGQNRSERFLRLGHIYSQARSNSFSGNPIEWADFEFRLRATPLVLDRDLVAFAIVLRALEREQTPYQTPVWTGDDLARFQALQAERLLGALPGGELGETIRRKIQSFTEDDALARYREIRNSEALLALRPDQIIQDQALATTAALSGLLLRKIFPSFRTPYGGLIPFERLEAQIVDNAPHSHARQSAEAERNRRLRLIREARRHADQRFGAEQGQAVEEYLQSAVRAHSARVDHEQGTCAFAIKQAVAAEETVVQARRRALAALSLSPAPEVTSMPVAQFMDQHLGSNRLTRRIFPKYRGMRSRLEAALSPTRMRLENIRLQQGERFSAMLPGQLFKRSFVEAWVSRASSLLLWGGSMTVGTSTALRAADWAWGSRQPDFKAIQSGTSDPLWTSVLENRPVAMAEVQQMQVDTLMAELLEFQEEWNAARTDRPQIEFILDSRSASEALFSTGRVMNFYVWAYQREEGQDPVSEYANLMNGVVLRFESVWENNAALKIEEAGQVGWRLAEVISLQGKDGRLRNQAAQAIDTNGFQYWLNPRATDLLFNPTR